MLIGQPILLPIGAENYDDQTALLSLLSGMRGTESWDERNAH